MTTKDLPSIRHAEGSAPNPMFGPATRVKLRLDLYHHSGRIDYSAIVWKHPQAHVIFNTTVENVGPIEHGVLVADICSWIAALIDEFSDPFPA